MKKKFYAGMVALTMAVTGAMPVFAVEKVDEITGDLSVSGFFAERTNAVELKSGEQYTFTFDNQSNGSNNWENFVMAVTGAVGADYVDAGQEIFVVRADSWGWGGGMSDFVAPNAAEGNKLAFTNDVANWDDWAPAMQAGVSCEVNIGRQGDTLIYNAKIGEYTVSTSATSGVALPESCYVFFTGENCDLTNFTTTKSEYKNPNALNVVDELSGDLTVGAFYSAKSDAVKVADGDSVTIKFSDKSNGENNWDNFVVGIAGDAEGYSGAASEIMNIRADAYGWGGGMSDFVAPGNEGNALLFVNDIDFEKFASEMQAGADVELTISKDGDMIIYEAKIAGYSVEMAAVSGVALPEDIYVYLSGENCTLTDISIVKEDVPDDSSDSDSSDTDSKPDDSEPDSSTSDGEDSSKPDSGDSDSSTTDSDDSSDPDDQPDTPKGKKGDINDDDKVNVTDVSLAAAHVKGVKSLSGDKLAKADVNGDGKVNVTDVSLIAAHIKGIKTLK